MMTTRAWLIRFNLAEMEEFSKRGACKFSVDATSVDEAMRKFRKVYPSEDGAQITLVRRA